MHSNQFLYLLYGGKATYRHEAKFSILSMLRQRIDPADFVITVMTDQPEAFAGWPVEIVPLGLEELVSWQGRGGYHHRQKACAIRAGVARAEKTIFIDTDTVFLKNPASLFERIDDSRFLMDQFEMTWGEAYRRAEFMDFAQELSLNGATPHAGLRLFNSGVLGITRSNIELLDAVVRLIDSWAHHGQTLFTIEQIAVSFVLEGKYIGEASDSLHHYFAVKDYYHAMLCVFFQREGEQFREALVRSSFQVPQPVFRNSLGDRLRIKWALKGLDAKYYKVAKYYFLGHKTDHCAYLSACRLIWWGKALEGLKAMAPNPRHRSKLNAFWSRDQAFLAFAARGESSKLRR